MDWLHCMWVDLCCTIRLTVRWPSRIGVTLWWGIFFTRSVKKIQRIRCRIVFFFGGRACHMPIDPEWLLVCDKPPCPVCYFIRVPLFVCCLSQWCCLSNVWVGGSWAGVSTRLLKVLRYQNLPLARTSTGSLCSADPVHLGDSYPRG